MNRRMQILVYVNERAERFYERAQNLGELAAHTFVEQGQGRGQGAESEANAALKKHRAQLTGLENIAETALKATDVLDYIKRQIARTDRKGWSQEYKGERFGENLKRYLEDEEGIKADIEWICAQMRIGTQKDEDLRDRQYIYLQLIRQLIRQLVVQYEYCVSQKVEEQLNAQRTGAATNTAHQR
jgi:hypothetical protein